MNQQGTYQWLTERAGHCTASRFADVMAKIKTGEAAVRRNYRIQLVTERLTGVPTNGFQSEAMKRGIELEPKARVAYEVLTGEPVIETGFHHHPSIEWCGASPDGLIGADGLFEAKCPEAQTHMGYILDGEQTDGFVKGVSVPSDYVAQVQGQLWVLNRQWADFVSYCPPFPKHLQLFVVRVKRDEDYIAKLETEVKTFLREVSALHSRLENGGFAKAA